MSTQTYRLGSSHMVHAPGLVAWAINGAAFEEDRPGLIKVITETWSIPEEAARQLVTKEVSYTVEGETVVFEGDVS